MALLLALALLPGCAAMQRMDYLDRFFDPAGYAARHAPLPPETVPPTLPPEAPEPEPAPSLAEPEVPSPEPPVAVAGPTPRIPESPEQRLRRTVRQNPWLTRFWTELTPAEQQRVARRLGPAGPSADPAERWDAMGLADRVSLVFGAAPAPAEPGWQEAIPR